MSAPATAAQVRANALLQVLLNARRGEAVPLAFAIEWERDGDAAWALATDWRRMLCLLGWDPHAEALAPDSPPPLVLARCAQLHTCLRREIAGACAVDTWRKPSACPPCARAISAVVRAPTLAAVLAAARVAGGTDG